MGLIKAGLGAIGGTFADQWKELIYCDAMDETVLVKKGQKRTSGRSSNTKGDDNIISSGSGVVVNDGQCMIIVEQGKIVEVCAEPGEFIFDDSTEPSIFGGSLGEGIKNTFAAIGKRFTYGGDTGKDQRVYYFNTKEIMSNKYGTATPVPFRVVDQNIGLDIDIAIRCHGEYSYKIVNPLLFYTNVCGNVQFEYRRNEIDSQLKSELLTALQPAFAEISLKGIRYSLLPAHTMEIAEALNDVLSKSWQETRGIKIHAFGVSSVSASKEDEDMIKELQRNAVFRNPNMAGAHLVNAQAEAMQSAAKNESGMGGMMGFMGMNMAQQSGGVNAQNLFAMGAQQQQQQQAPVAQPSGWTCSSGHSGNTGKFCADCGAPKPQEQGWTCNCGAVNKGKFCAECGSKKPIGAVVYQCDKCGWQPEDTTKVLKFCPECGDPFDENDIKQ